MTRRRCTSLLASLLLAAGVVVSPEVFGAADIGKEIEGVAGRAAEALTAGGRRPSVAVVDFTDLSGNPSELGRFLAEEMSVALAGTPQGLEVVDRTHLKALLQEHKLSAAGLIDPATARKLGQVSGVQALVTGTFTPFGENVRVALKVLDTQSARILHATTFELARTKTIEQLLGRELGEKAPAAQSSNGAPAASPFDAAHARPRPALAPAAGQRVGSFLVSVDACEREGRMTTCTGTIVNTRSEGAPIAFHHGGCYAVDNLGQQGSREVEIAIGSGGSEASLEPQIPMRFHFSFTGLSREATSATVVLTVAGYSLGRGFGRWSDERLTFRNVQLEEAK